MRVQFSPFEPLKSLQLVDEEPRYPIVWLMIGIETRKLRVFSKRIGSRLDAFLVVYAAFDVIYIGTRSLTGHAQAAAHHRAAAIRVHADALLPSAGGNTETGGEPTRVDVQLHVIPAHRAR
jgi:hypothetical protein